MNEIRKVESIYKINWSKRKEYPYKNIIKK